MLHVSTSYASVSCISRVFIPSIQACRYYESMKYPGVRPAHWPKHGSARPKRHMNQKFKHMRERKMLKVDLSFITRHEDHMEHEEARNDHDTMREYMKKRGLPSLRQYSDRGRDRPIHVSCTSSVIDEYVPPEGDGRASLLTRDGVGQLWEKISQKSKELLKHVRTIRSYDDEFDPKTFGETVAVPVFIDAHKALMNRDITRMHETVTESAFSVMFNENLLRSVKWELVESLEPARVVHVRTAPALHDDNFFGQVTVRMHTKQKLAIYDQFGRLHLGNEEIARDVLEYVVYERHLVDPYGTWRLHGKVTPQWLPPKDSVIRTFKRVHKEPKSEAKEITKVEEFLPVKDTEPGTKELAAS